MVKYTNLSGRLDAFRYPRTPMYNRTGQDTGRLQPWKAPGGLFPHQWALISGTFLQFPLNRIPNGPMSSRAPAESMQEGLARMASSSSGGPRCRGALGVQLLWPTPALLRGVLGSASWVPGASNTPPPRPSPEDTTH